MSASSRTLEPILEPSSVVVIGVSRDPRKRGYQALRALKESGYRGRIHAVHPAGGEVLKVAVSPSVETLEETPDLAYIATRAAAIPALVEACGRKGIRGAVIPAVGFRESGLEGEALERAVLEAARRTGIRVIGPNTSGIVNTSIGLNLVGSRAVPAGRLALVTQSGNVGLQLMTELAARGQGVSVYVGIGNETDVAQDEVLEYLEEDPATAAILMYVEGFQDGRRFLGVATRVNRTKPIVLLKGGRTAGGEASARSHTGALAGSYRVLRSALQRAALVEVTRGDELLAIGETLAGQPTLSSGAGVAILADGGGHATLAADAMVDLSMPLARLGASTRERLRSLLGPAASVANPVDLAGAADGRPSAFAEALEEILADPAVGGVLVTGLFGGYAIRFAEELAAEEAASANRMVEIARAAGKPIVVHTLYHAARTDPLRRLAAAGVPVLGSLETAARCLWAARERGRAIARSLPARVTGAAASVGPATPDPPRRAILTEPEIRELIAELGIPIVQATFCRTAEETAKAAERADGPVAVKVVSGSISHKSDAGGVALGVNGSHAARAAFERVTSAARAHLEARADRPHPDIDGVTVSSMLPPPVAELIVGARRDPQFGPFLLLGAGGLTAEIEDDVAVRMLPVGPDEVEAMLDELRIAPVLRGFRGRPGVDRAALAALAVALASGLQSRPDLFTLEANPVFAYVDRAIAVDLRAVVDSPETG
ncbi:MAG TPA: acetate--CoA ligase family protein [Gemmatimonadota bacterium]|nr:acetate--CoA ligase family protein [Gemmatimonadota bacterium]